jgi:hypothetical protein
LSAEALFLLVLLRGEERDHPTSLPVFTELRLGAEEQAYSRPNYEQDPGDLLEVGAEFIFPLPEPCLLLS